MRDADINRGLLTSRFKTHFRNIVLTNVIQNFISVGARDNSAEGTVRNETVFLDKKKDLVELRNDHQNFNPAPPSGRIFFMIK